MKISPCRARWPFYRHCACQQVRCLEFLLAVTEFLASLSVSTDHCTLHAVNTHVNIAATPHWHLYRDMVAIYIINEDCWLCRASTWVSEQFLNGTSAHYRLTVMPILQSVCVCVSVKHISIPCKNGRSYWDAIWGKSHTGLRDHVLQGGLGVEREWVRHILTAHQHIIGYSVPWKVG